MGEPLRYVVVCSCTGSIEPIAYIDDARPAAEITVDAVSEGRKRTVSQIGYRPGDARWRAPDGFEVESSKSFNVTRTVLDWDDMTSWWMVRCVECDTQAQMNDTNLRRIGDKFAAAAWPVVPTPVVGDPPVLRWDADGRAVEFGDAEISTWVNRNLVPLSVLVTESQGNV